MVNNKGLKARMPSPNGQIAKMAALSRPKFCLNLQPSGSSQRQWKPPLRQAAKTLPASGRQRIGYNEREKQSDYRQLEIVNIDKKTNENKERTSGVSITIEMPERN